MSQKLYVQWIQKVRILWKNGLNFKLKHRNPQKSILSGRFGALTGRPGDLMKNLETPWKTGRVGRYAYVPVVHSANYGRQYLIQVIANIIGYFT